MYTKVRKLGRKSSHRIALLRNLVTSLVEHETISTTYPKAKEAQKLAEKVITLAKKNTEASRERAKQILFRPHDNLPKLFGTLAERYKERPGGYTRVLRIEPLKTDQAPSAILEFVDGPKDMRFHMTAKTIAACQAEKKDMSDFTVKNIKKVTQFRSNGQAELEKLVQKLRTTTV
ncbi:ribosomal protein L17 [Pyronema domesticum]|uniref:Large ribosomal subunit protein bL17m n=1 Tax=Pyronema omphalodes (strain CBS 100304) TaxID=1076935 RepID=U4KXS9_PYROM|nr:ribosomal protein L17 [Pyronema domesticum]CCX06977.1 Similar to 54S ribosomal protein L8, mitochondrial; acc. no. O94345 [Pyronema omphalodes CBS 100304]